jgi:DMSO reductase anchor subunit
MTTTAPSQSMTRPSEPVVLIPAMRQRLWGIPAVLNFVLGGLGAGFYAVAALTAGLGPSAALTVASWLGPVLVLAGFVAVATEAGRPLRGPRVLARVRTSWMSRELVLGGAFAVLAAAEWAAPSPPQRALAAAAGLAVVAAQGFILRRARAVIAWDVSVMPLVFVVSALMSGAGLLLAFEPVLGVGSTYALGGTLTLLPLAFVGWLMYLAWSQAPAFQRATRPLRAAPGEMLGVVGYLLPWMLIAVALALPQLAVAVPAAGVLLVAGQAWSKWLVMLTVAEMRAVTLGRLTLQRRVS